MTIQELIRETLQDTHNFFKAISIVRNYLQEEKDTKYSFQELIKIYSYKN